MQSNQNVDIAGKYGRRRQHKNSKLGCSTCKKRRVKCDENFPECNNCIKRGVRCGYLDLQQLSKRKDSSGISDKDFEEVCSWFEKGVSPPMASLALPQPVPGASMATCGHQLLATPY
ncbi:hypothetical protein DICA3_F36818 [Diutina catenulata]